MLVDGIAERIAGDEGFRSLPVVVIGTAQQNANVEIDVDQIVGDQFAVDDHAGSDEHLASPLGHVFVGVIAVGRDRCRSPSSQAECAAGRPFRNRQRLVEEVEEIVVQRHDLLHELDVLHQANQIVGEELNGSHGADAAGIERGRMHVPAFHQAEHLARHAAHRQRLAIEAAGEGIERGHDVGDGAVAVLVGVGRGRMLRFFPDAGIGLLHHLLAEVDADQVVLKDVVVEHVLGGFAEIDDPLSQCGGSNAEGHVLRIARRRWRGCRRRCRRCGW